MKKIVALFMLVALVFSCKNEAKETSEVKEKEVTKEIAYASFGDKIEADGAMSADDMAKKYKTLAVGDTIQTKVTAKINEVCSKKGCWMKLDLGESEEMMVRFKDYGFFMPLNAEGDVVVNGKAYVTETSVDELRHYAEDAGKSKEEIEAITEPKRTLAFEADGVLLKE
jgi:hypothetical protein